MGLFDWILKRKKEDMTIEWSEKYSVGIIELDAQHRKLFLLYNDLIYAMYKGVGYQELESALNELLDYTINHFMTEENYLKKYGYPELEPHMIAHRDFRNLIYNLNKDFHEKKPVLTMEVIDYVKKWLNEHVLGVDQRYKKFLIEKGAR